MRDEWAATAEDVLWRRSKLGLRLTADERAALDAFMRAARRRACAALREARDDAAPRQCRRRSVAERRTSPTCR